MGVSQLLWTPGLSPKVYAYAVHPRLNPTRDAGLQQKLTKKLWQSSSFDTTLPVIKVIFQMMWH